MAEITGTTRLAGIIGWPVGHSRSPLLHNHWCARHGINGAYMPLPVRPEDLGTALAGLKAAGFAGVNLTIPHKEAALALMDRLDRSAARAGAVNTVVFTPSGETIGYCTDGTGFVEDLDAHGVPSDGRVLILGAGGAARAIAASLQDRGAAIVVANRTQARAERLVADLGLSGVVSWEDWPQALHGFDLLVNTTSIGLGGEGDGAFDLRAARPELCVADIVYSPEPTPLLRAAHAQELRAIDGFGMLARQAVEGFALWFGTRPQVDDELLAVMSAKG